jgi:transcriptional regulator with AbiEi antitoxin domain of type IV toxin-antitoxin system
MNSAGGLFIIKITAIVAVNIYFYKLLVGAAWFVLIIIHGDYRRLVWNIQTMPVNAKIRSELITLVPHGLVATRRWLMAQGLSGHSLDNLVKSKQLISLSHGVYKRPETKVTWQGLVRSLQRMGYDLTVGGLTSLSLQGYEHYVSMSTQKSVYLYGSDKLPAWANKVAENTVFIYHSHSRLVGNKASLNDFTTEIPWLEDDPPMKVSSLELALFEVLLNVPNKVSFEHAGQLMQGLLSLSPWRLDKLLKKVTSVKVKRLFFYLADRGQYQWRGKLNPDHYDLGKGKRVLAKGGTLDKKYQITVPEAIDGQE